MNDDFITGEGETQEILNKDHDEMMRQFLNRCREQNIKLNVDKFRLRRQEVSYVGLLLTAED